MVTNAMRATCWAAVVAMAAATASGQSNGSTAAAATTDGAATATSSQAAKSLWIAKFQCDTKAAQAVAGTQQADFAALQYSNLFTGVTQFTSQASAPAAAWTLTAKELEFAGGSAAERALIGWGTGRAHLVMLYELHDPSGKVVWSKKLKTEPSFWGSTGYVGPAQNQGAAWGKQGQALVEALQKYFQGPTKKSKHAS
jgi:hypothetical protein